MGDEAEHLEGQCDGGAEDYRHTCRRCGERWLKWTEEPEGWRLSNEVGIIHRCSPVHKKSK